MRLLLLAVLVVVVVVLGMGMGRGVRRLGRGGGMHEALMMPTVNAGFGRSVESGFEVGQRLRDELAARPVGALFASGCFFFVKGGGRHQNKFVNSLQYSSEPKETAEQNKYQMKKTLVLIFVREPHSRTFSEWLTICEGEMICS